MAKVDTFALLQEIYEDGLSTFFDLYEMSHVHREAHGEECTVHPSAPEAGPLWPFLVTLLGARRFLEVGCGLGYTAALMAEAAGPGAVVDTIEGRPDHADLAEVELAKRGLADRVRIVRGDAKVVLPDLAEPYDVIFVDADWHEYPMFLPELVRLTRPGGILVTANLFPLFEEWAQDMPHQDAVKEYLVRLVREPQFQTFIVPGEWHALSVRR